MLQPEWQSGHVECPAMSRRLFFTRGTGSARALMFAIAGCAVVVAACGDEPGRILRASDYPSTTSSTTTTVAETTVAPETTALPDTTVAPTVPPSIPLPPGTEHVPDGAAPSGPAPETVRPPASWVGFGIPQPGSMFENLQE